MLKRPVDAICTCVFIPDAVLVDLFGAEPHNRAASAAAAQERKEFVTLQYVSQHPVVWQSSLIQIEKASPPQATGSSMLLELLPFCSNISDLIPR